MDQRKDNSTRIIVDLQASQTPGYFQRGVGNYSLGFFNGLIQQYRREEVFSLASDSLPHALEGASIRADRHINLRMGLDWDGLGDFEGGNLDSLGSIAYSAQCQSFKPDVIHVSHNFLDSRERVAGPGVLQPVPGQILSTTLFDLIPLKFDYHYLREELSRRRYYFQLEKLRRFDLLFAISESTRKDAIDLLGIEPWRIVTVHGGVSPVFEVNIDRARATNQVRKRYKLNTKILLYTGGDDFRKNISGLIKGFAALAEELRDQTSLVVVGKISDASKATYLKLARECGLGPRCLVFTNYIEDAELIAFYQACDAFVFPSIYEGLGLPLLEAMYCGAAVIGGNNSSISELVGREDALFEATEQPAITASIERVLTDQQFADSLRTHSRNRAGQFSWANTAALAKTALDEALARSRARGVKNALSSWLPRKRMAMLTPLPPCQSGVAEYASSFLPYLGRHFDIDIYLDGYRTEDIRISSAFRIFDLQDFEQNASAYDAILYEIGNSDFHTHMLGLLQKYPGIVTLHDAYMSGILAHLEFSLNQKYRYEIELLYSHGPRGRQYIAPNSDDRKAVGIAVDTLPTTKRILDNAIGIISHSSFNLNLARENYPEGWLAPYRTIPQMIACKPTSADQAAAARQALKLPANAFVIATFGHVVWTKCGDQILQAFLDSRVLQDAGAHLVFVGKLADDEFGNKLKKSIHASGARDKIRVTGFLNADDYQNYIRAADLAIQLRSSSRGGTPRSVLDCLAHGLPVILNDYASFQDYPDSVVAKIPAKISPTALCTRIEAFYTNHDMLESYATAGMQYIRQNHDPAKCAAAYAAAVHEFSQRHAAVAPASYAQALAPHLDSTKSTQFRDALLKQIRPVRMRRRQLIIDVSHIASGDHQTGIQRIVRDLVGALYKTNLRGIEPIAVELKEGKLIPARDWLCRQMLLSSYEQATDNPNPVSIERGDILLMLDSSWDRYTEFYPVFELARQVGVPIVTVVYDLLPLSIPECFVDGGPEWFESWFTKALQQSDAMICISAATKSAVESYLDAHTITAPPQVGYWHHGCDIVDKTPLINKNSLPLPLKDQAYLLMVGTIEPRKLHSMALAAMEILWDRDVTLKLCIAGKPGWLVEDFMQKLQSPGKQGEHLIFVEAPADDQLAKLYNNAAGLLFLSKGEGFGLPLIEAASYGIPIICSDIPAFREVATNHATFTRAESPVRLAEDILAWHKLKSMGELPDSSLIKINSCQQSAEALVKVLLEKLDL